MANRTAIIDIGSNSARLVIFQKTSSYGFHLICEQKSKVRIGEGAYENGGNLQKIGTDRAYNALQSFSQTIKEFKVNKIICVATSALRDAPNRDIFLSDIKDKLGLTIRVIDGKEEALYGAIAANNLLNISDGITIDIGGGSSDMALIKNNKVIDTYSLDLGTVRLKELFFDKELPISEVHQYIDDALKDLPVSFRSKTAIGIGGTVRTLAKSIMNISYYPLNKLHAFGYRLDTHYSHLKEISDAKINNLEKLSIKSNRHDTIREGTTIFLKILEQIGAKDIITSGVGVREGVYLHEKLKKSQEFRFPKNSNPSMRSIKDRFDILALPHGNKRNIAKKLYSIFHSQIDSKQNYLPVINRALALSNIGKMLTIYHQNRHAHYIAMQELNYGLSHQEMVLIALLLSSKESKRYPKELYLQYETLLPSKKTVKWLSFIYTLTILLHRNSAKANINFEYSNESLQIKSDKNLYLAKEDIANMKKLKNMNIVIECD